MNVKEKSICSRCGKDNDDNNYKQCSDCRKKNAEYKKIRYAKGLTIKSKYRLEKDKENREKLKSYRIENNLCYICGKPNDEENYSSCSKCRKHIREIRKEAKEYKEKIGVCNSCGKNKVFGNEKRCPECRAKQCERRSKYDDAKKKELQEKRNFYRREKARKNRENGLCSCGRNRDSEIYLTCSRCRKKSTERQRLSLFRKGKLTLEEKKQMAEKGKCFRCGEDVMSGFNQKGEKYKLCAKCFEIASNNLGKANNEKHIWRNDNKLIFKGGK